MKFWILMGMTLITTPVMGAVVDSTAVVAGVAPVIDSMAAVVPGTVAVDSTVAAADMTALPDVSSLITRMVLSLGVVLLLIWGAVHVLQRLSGNSNKLGGAESHIRVLDRTYLAPKKAVYVLKIGSRSLAVGVTDNQITPLAELDAEETNLAYPTTLPNSGTPSFANLLKDVRTRIAGGQA